MIYKEVAMKDIVDNAGLSKGAFYHYFDSREWRDFVRNDG
ncbi:MAG: TetR/AcrR family transcriptional regulator [Bacteroidales bacterium]|nr:TetR/AcrR family transcriptional regulator [Bacteroidales bacterium]